MSALDIDVDAIPRDELPSILGRLVELEACVRLRLAEPAAGVHKEETRILDVDEAAALAGVSRRWLLTHTRGLRSFRKDHSRKTVRFDEAGLRTWLALRGGR